MNEQTTARNVELISPDADKTETTNLSRLIAVLDESRWLIGGIAAAVFLIGVAYSFFGTPIYEADTVLHVLTQQTGGLSGIEMLSTLLQGSQVPTDTEIQLLQTRAVLVPVIEKLNLDIAVGDDWNTMVGSYIGTSCKSPARVSMFRVPADLQDKTFTVVPTGHGTYRLLGPDGASVVTGRVGTPAVGRAGDGIVELRIESIAPCAGSFGLSQIPVDQVVRRLQKSLTIEEVSTNTGVVRVALRGKSPELLTRELNLIAQTNVEQNILQNASQAALQVKFLGAQIPDVENQLHETQAKLAAFLSANPTLAALSQSTEYLMTQEATIDQQMGPLQVESAEAKAALGSQNPKLSIINAQLQALLGQRAQLLAGIAKLPKDQQQLVRLQSDVTTSEGLYQAMLNQLQTLQVAKAGTVSDVVIVDLAIIPSLPVEPNKLLIIPLSLLVGLFLGAATAFVRRALRHGIEDPEVLDEQLGLPVFAVLPHSALQKRLERGQKNGQPGSNTLLAAIGAEDPTTEALRSLRTALRLALPNGGKGVICVTSPSPNEGKSFVAGNLGYLFAQAGLRVLIIDADLRRGHLHRVFGWQRGKGLAEVLRGEALPENVIHKTEFDNLDVLTTGELPDDAANLLVHADIAGVLDRLKSTYDLIVADVPPVLAVSDAYILSRHATVNLLLLKHGLHSASQVRLIIRRFTRQGTKLQGSILNDVSAAAQRYAYGGYGYQYQYRYYK